jgi:pimeloyl-ACP methyl ester carboxylesterase
VLSPCVCPKSSGRLGEELVSAREGVRWGDLDDVTPPAENARVYADFMPRAAGASVGATAGHYVFVGDREDPSDVREAAAADVVDFFTRYL